MTKNASRRLIDVNGGLVVQLFAVTYQIPCEWLARMSGELGLTEEAEAVLANPQVRVMIFEAPYGAEKIALRNFEAAKKHRPEVIFLVLQDPISFQDYEEHQRLFEEAGADYVLYAHLDPSEMMERIAKISQPFMKKLT